MKLHPLELSFHGAARMVTGSKHLITLANSYRVLLDCGMFQGHSGQAYAMNREWGFDPQDIDVVLLSHAHIDHSGLLPRLVAQGFAGPIWCTSGTRDLAEALLMDSAKIQEADVRYLRKKHRDADIEPLYSAEDVERTIHRMQTVPFFEEVTLREGVTFHFTEAGHIIGSGVINLRITDKERETKICFTGDVGRYNDEILTAPSVFPQSDVIICESTYGDSLHPPIEATDRKLLEIITDTCLRKKGKLIIPAFSVGRTQELVYALNRLDVARALPPIPFYVDSPLSSKATEVTIDHSECYNNRLLKYMERDPEPFDFPNLHYITDVEDSIKLNTRNEPCVIISASGMADAGRVKHHIKHAISDSRNSILIVGYCEPQSLGARLSAGRKEVTIFGAPYPVEAEIYNLRSFSAHADYDDLIQFLGCQTPSEVKNLFIVHGEPDTQSTFKQKLAQRGFRHIDIPELHQRFTL